MIKQIFVGLGNPGDEYKGTRHNIGRDFLENFVESQGASFKKEEKLYSKLAFLEFNSSVIVFAIPLVYMNESGKAVAKLLKEFEVEDCTKLCVVHDELNLPFASLKLSFNKSAGGHNGVESVINSISSKEFYRLRLGIGKKNGKTPSDMKSYVLKKFSMLEKLELNEFYGKFEKAMFVYINEGPEVLMNKINKL